MKLNLTLTQEQINELLVNLNAATKELQTAVKAAVVKARAKQELKALESEASQAS